jgi:RNA polymerase sigma-70 factor (ECF subfamily)
MSESDPEEHALIERAKGDREAFGMLYERHVQRIYSYLYYRTGNYADAEDLTARVFFRALHHIDRYQDNGAPFSAWLYRIARNLLANWYRDQSRRRLIPLDRIGDQKSTSGPEQINESEEERAILLTAIRRLPPDRQELLILKHVERLPNAEIGQIMGRSEGAIKSLYHRTLEELHEELAGGESRDEARSRDRRRQPANSRGT